LQRRPQFEGEPSTNPVDGRKMLYFPASVLLFRTIVSVSIIGTLILIVLCIVASIFVVRIAMNSSSAFVVGGVATGSIIASIANAVQIQVRHSIYLAFDGLCAGIGRLISFHFHAIINQRSSRV
jgi:hypothetical protein